jgi:hypothetical protein
LQKGKNSYQKKQKIKINKLNDTSETRRGPGDDEVEKLPTCSSNGECIITGSRKNLTHKINSTFFNKTFSNFCCCIKLQKIQVSTLYEQEEDVDVGVDDDHDDDDGKNNVDQEEDVPFCAICHDVIVDGEDIATVDCHAPQLHKFHFNCIIQQLRNMPEWHRTKCCLCRGEFRLITYRGEELSVNRFIPEFVDQFVEDENYYVVLRQEVTEYDGIIDSQELSRISIQPDFDTDLDGDFEEIDLKYKYAIGWDLDSLEERNRVISEDNANDSCRRIEEAMVTCQNCGYYFLGEGKFCQECSRKKLKCAGCGNLKTRNQYSRTQRQKKHQDGESVARCIACVHGVTSADDAEDEVADGDAEEEGGDEDVPARFLDMLARNNIALRRHEGQYRYLLFLQLRIDRHIVALREFIEELTEHPYVSHEIVLRIVLTIAALISYKKNLHRDLQDIERHMYVDALNNATHRRYNP